MLNRTPEDAESLTVPSAPPEQAPRRRSLRWLYFPAILAVGALLGYAAHVATLSDPTGQATVIVTPLIGNPYSPTSASLQNMETEAQLVTADKVSARAAEALGVARTADALAADTTSRVVPGSQVVEITNRSATPEAARSAAEAYAEAFLGERRQRATRYIDDQSAALQTAIDKAEKQLQDAAKELSSTRAGTAARQLAQQNLNIASETLAARTDEFSALSSMSTDPGQLIALTSTDPERNAWLWVGGGLLAGSAVVALVVLGRHRSRRSSLRVGADTAP